jgi:hypothetical protein
MRLCLFFFLFTSVPALAEYRMFLLQITSADGTPGAQIKSNLDPDQYQGYHHLQAGEKITYIDTWMCFGRTNEIPACDSPRDPASLSTTSANPNPNPTTPAVLETPAAPPPAADLAKPAAKTPP